MNIQSEKMQMIFRRDTDYGTSYMIGMSKKKQDGNYENAYFPVQFKKEVELKNKTNIYIKDAWLTFYKTKDMKTIFYIFINDFNTVHDEANEFKDASVKTETKALDSLGIQIEDQDLPF